ncbi:MAG: hypothetical protein ACE5OZ_23145 [Candidatus Heimdallarchaeota archaeon]
MKKVTVSILVGFIVGILIGVMAPSAMISPEGTEWVKRERPGEIVTLPINTSYFVLHYRESGYNTTHFLNQTIEWFWISFFNAYYWQNDGIIVSIQHNGSQIYRETFSDEPVQFATDWVLTRTRKLPYAIDMTADTIHISISNANEVAIEGQLRWVG